MDRQGLEYFLRIAELGSINKAAFDLQISQPALSRQIALLEQDLGARLFTRSRSGVEMTDAGKILHAGAGPILHQMALLRDDVGKRTAGQVTLGMPPSMQLMVSAPLVERIVKEAPGVRLRIHEAINNILRDMMSGGLIDLCIGAFDVAAMDGYTRTPIVREPLLLVGDNDAGLRPDETVALSRLRHTKLILPGRPNIIRHFVEQALKRDGHPMPVMVEANVISLCLELTRRGVGYTVMPYCALQDNPSVSKMCWAPIRGLSLTWALFEKESRMHSPAVRSARKHLFAHFDYLFEQKRWPGAERAA
jgi:LysR family nitrogen assimilation transcriptional regulator